MDFYFNGAWRMDWGLGNPNKTAALISSLMVAGWSMALVWEKGFWPSLLVFTALAWCLVETYSRGGVVALVAGIVVLLIWIPRPWPKARWIAVFASLWLLGGFVLYAKAQARYGQGLFAEDQSINNRLVIWRHVPEMMAAAPWGWGFRKAGDSYTQWFQPSDQSQSYLNLVNSHFNFMVEAGWLGAALYLFAWLAILILCWPRSQSRLRSVSLAIWVTFGIAACFSHVEESMWLWIVPFGALVYALWERICFRDWPAFSCYVISGAISVFAVAMLVGIGIMTASVRITCSDGMVTVGEGSVRTVIYVDRNVMGSLYGHVFRKYREKNYDSDGACCFVESSMGLPSIASARVVYSGRWAGESVAAFQHEQANQVILVNPMCSPGDLTLIGNSANRLTVYFGEYSPVPSRASWLSVPGIKPRQIDGASDFIPSWPQAILSAPKT